MAKHESGEETIAEAAEREKYGTFDDLVDAYDRGEFGEPGKEAWEAMMTKYGQRAKVILNAGVTALSGDYDEQRAESVADIASLDAEVAARREERLVVELLAGIEKYETTE